MRVWLKRRRAPERGFKWAFAKAERCHDAVRGNRRCPRNAINEYRLKGMGVRGSVRVEERENDRVKVHSSFAMWY
jgi:hypothetical protein